MTRRIPTRYTEGPWPFLLSVDMKRGGIVRNLGPKPVKERVRITLADVVVTATGPIRGVALMHFRKGGTRWNRK